MTFGSLGWPKSIGSKCCCCPEQALWGWGGRELRESSAITAEFFGNYCRFF